MLRTPETTLVQEQQQQRQQNQLKRSKSGHNKVNGGSNSLFKATSKVLAFLNRKSHASSHLDHESQRLGPSHFLPQTNNNASQRRGPLFDSLDDNNSIEQYKHIFQNRPLLQGITRKNVKNNKRSRNNNINNKSHTSIIINDGTTSEPIFMRDETSKNDLNTYSNNNNRHHEQHDYDHYDHDHHNHSHHRHVTPKTSLPEGILSSRSDTNYTGMPSSLSSSVLSSEQHSLNDTNNDSKYPQKNIMATGAEVQEEEEKDDITDQERLLAKEQLRIVRRNLRNCSPQSLYFRRFAALADDWRNFLPMKKIHKKDKKDNTADDDGLDRYEDDCRSSSDVFNSDDESSLDREQLSMSDGDRDAQLNEVQEEEEAGPEAEDKNQENPVSRTDRRGARSTSVTFQDVEKEQHSDERRPFWRADYGSLLDEDEFFDAMFYHDCNSRSSSQTSFMSSTSSTRLTDDTEANDADADDDDDDDDDDNEYDEMSNANSFFKTPSSSTTASRSSVQRIKTTQRTNNAPTHRSHCDGSNKMILAEKRAHELAHRSIQQHRQAKCKAIVDEAAVATDQKQMPKQNHRQKQVNRKAQKRVRSNEIRKLGVAALTLTAPYSSSGKKIRSSRRRTKNQYQPSFQLPQTARFGEIRIEDIVRGIESEFTLFASDDDDDAEGYRTGYEDNEDGSEDSLTFLISGYGSSHHGPDENRSEIATKEESKVVASVQIIDSQACLGASTSSSCIGPTRASISCYKPRSPEIDEILQSHSSVSELTPSIVVEEAQTPDRLPQYLDQELDHIIILPPAGYDNVASTAAQQQDAASISASTFADTLSSIEEETTLDDETDEETSTVGLKATSQVKPSLTLQTLTHTMGSEGIAAGGALSAFGNRKRPLGSQHSLTKCNSTSSLYIDSTMAKSDVDETLRAVATVLYEKVLQSHRMNDCRTERIINSSSYIPSERVMMTQADIFDFMRFIFDCGQNLGAENAIITLIYVERITELGNLSFHAINWRRLLLGALILSIKVWEDLAVFNSDVCAIFEGLAVKDVNALERFSMAKLQYNVSVKRSLYAAYYFRLRDVSEQQYNLHYGRLTLSMSQRDVDVTAVGFPARSMTRNNSRINHPSQSGSNVGLTGTTAVGAGLGMVGHSSTNSSSSSTATTHSRVPIGPGYRKWTLKPLSVREADRLEARSSIYSSNLIMERQERKDVGCYWDEYSYSYSSGLTTPAEELNNLSASLLAAASSMHTIASMTSTLTSGSTVGQSKSTISKSTSASSNTTKISSSSTSDLTIQEGGVIVASKIKSTDNGHVEGTGGTEPLRRALRLKKSRSDFFFQNTTPVSIM
ncbi:hypothetical protein BGX28_002898 [Mortierella sp. GBA30]|nr:hypothetical protein BGX28_002898 [Mortierella sp. GBA30]